MKHYISLFVSVIWIFRCICYEPSCQLVHVWRAFAYRRLGQYARAIKSLTTRVPLFMGQSLCQVYGDIFRLVALPTWNFYEEDVVTLYWEEMWSLADNYMENCKIDHVLETSFQSEDELHGNLSMEFLGNNPTFHDTVIVDSNSMRILPSTFRAILETQAYKFHYQVSGHKDRAKELQYFQDLPKTSKYLIKKLGRIKDFRIKPQVVESVKIISNMAEILNCSSCELRLIPGYGIHERLLLCFVLLQNREFELAQQEYRCLKADLMLSVLLARRSDLKCYPSVTRHLSAVRKVTRALKGRLEREGAEHQFVGNLMHWLKDCSMKWTVGNMSTKSSRTGRDKSPRKGKSTRAYKSLRKEKRRCRGYSDKWKLTHSSPRKLRFNRTGASV